uniref:DNA-directed RNA polymerase n=1 Tax=Avrainvillea sp. HV04061 TaxID=2364086 RepID=A0A3B8CLZ7_9CHLO|nr:RNA polymerase b-subunit [Avrainvillea sp. HV04061]
MKQHSLEFNMTKFLVLFFFNNMFFIFYKFLFFFPDFLNVQRKSFRNFIKNDFIFEFSKIKKIVNSKKLNLKFLYENFKFLSPIFNIEESILLSKTYCSNFYIPVISQINRLKYIFNYFSNSTELKWILVGTLPLLTRRGHFIINGTIRIVINQILRSPGLYVYKERRKNENTKRLYYADLISQRGAWLRVEIDKDKKLWLSTKSESRIPFFEFLKNIGFKQKFIIEYFSIDLIDIKTKKKKSLKNNKFLYQTFFNPLTYSLGFIGRKRLNNKFDLLISPKVLKLTPLDFLAIGDYLIQLTNNLGSFDDIDHLKNRRIRTIGDLILNQFQQGLIRFRNLVFGKQIKKNKKINLNNLLDFQPINSAFRELFVGSQLSQFLDQTNPLAELTHKRRFSALGSGGVNRETAGFEIRGIHPTHYGRICPIETPEGHNAGLVNSITMTTQINDDGFLETPYRLIYKSQIQDHKNPLFLTAEYEESRLIVLSDIPVCKFKFLKNKNLPILFNQDFQKFKVKEINFISVSSLQYISLATALIPFIEHDDANRALMGSNMQRQAIPLISLEQPLITTYAAKCLLQNSKVIPICKRSGFIIYSSNKKISCYSFLNFYKFQCRNSFLIKIFLNKSINFRKKNYSNIKTTLKKKKTILKIEI